MVFSVTSSFAHQRRQHNVLARRRFYIGTSDYAAHVLKWPSVTKRWNDFNPKSMTIKLANEKQTFNFFKADPTKLHEDVRLEFGLRNNGTGSYEYIDIFNGTVQKVTYDGGTVQVRLEDKFKPFTERTVGDNDNPVDYTTSDYYPSTIAWDLITCYGGLSSVASTSNVDLDYDSYTEWESIFSADTVLARAYFTGEKVVEALKIIGRATDSTIFEEDGKIYFNRYNTSSVEPYSLDATINVKCVVDDSSIINKKIVNAGYDVNSKEFGIVVSDVVTSSVNSYGTHEQIEESKKFWYVNSVSALNFAQRVTSTYGEPYNQFTVKTPLTPLGKTIGDTVTFNESLLDQGGDSFRIMGYTFDMDKCEFSLTVNDTQLSTNFILDVDTFSALDQSYNPLG